MTSTPKKLVINGRFLTQQRSGVQNYAIGMMKALEKAGQDFEIASPKDGNNGGIGGFIWEQFSLPRYVKQQENAFLLNFCNSAPLNLKQQAVTIHDLAFEADPGDWFKFTFRQWYKYMIPKVARNASLVWTVSGFSKQEIARHYKISDKKITVVPNGTREIGFDDSIKPEGKYLLLTGIENPRKNGEWTMDQIDLIASKGFSLVVLRNKSGAFKNIILPKHPQITYYENLSPASYFSLLKGASALLYPSHYEGFGLPILESLVIGTPVIASDLSVFKESFGELPIYFKQHDSKAFEAALESIPLKQITATEQNHLKEQYHFDRSVSILLQSIQSLPK